MGTIAHDTIIVTSWREDHIQQAWERATDLFTHDDHPFGAHCIVSPIVTSITNGYVTFFVAPDGSKEGWDTSDWADRAREEFITWLEERGSFDWVAVRYGDENGASRVTADPKQEVEDA